MSSSEKSTPRKAKLTITTDKGLTTTTTTTASPEDRPKPALPHKPYGFDFYEAMGRPRLVVAPMVDQSEHAYRLQTRRHGAELCYTPMFHSRLFGENEKYREQFQTSPEDRPLLVQFCGNDPDVMLRAALLVQDRCDGVDINLGCPQGIARKGNYGSFLLEKTDLLVRMVSTLHHGLKVPVTCKIRLLPKMEDTLHLARSLEAAGCALLCVHGRTRDMKQQHTGKCDWKAIRRVKDAVSIPVISNGGIGRREDVDKCLQVTRCEGVMTSEAILENAAFFDTPYPKGQGPTIDLQIQNAQE
jgi:tRNA-dihydrouridine synthase 1